MSEVPQGAQVIKDFQLNKQGIAAKSNPDYGIAIGRYISSIVNSGQGGYFFERNARFAKNRLSAAGQIDMTQFQDLMEINGKTNFVNINWQSIRIVNRIISGLVGVWMGRSEKIQVKATDSLSLNEKKQQYEDMEFYMANKAMLEQLQQKSGVQLIPQDTQIPEDSEELNLWVTQTQRLPEEIKYEMGCNDVLASCGWFDVLKEKILWDAATVGLIGTYTWMDTSGVIHVDYRKPEDIFYSYSEYPDFRDTSWRGCIRSLKISEVRRNYGKEFGGTLTEEQLWDIAQKSKDYQMPDKITWVDNWVTAFTRPYDEWNVDVLDWEIKTVDSEPFTVVRTNNKNTFIKKGKSRNTPTQKEQEDTKWNIYQGCYLKDCDILLSWKLKDNMIRPHDPKEMGNAEFSYSFYMYQNFNMRNIAIPEKIEEPSNQMILTRLKIQQLIAKMRPIGAAYNVDALQEVDLGLASGVSKPNELQKIYDQTGNMYFRGKDAEGNPIPIPITELKNSGFLDQMKGLIDLYSFHYQVLKDELGIDPNLISQALQPRVTTGNVDAAQTAANNATDYMFDSYKVVMGDNAKKICCLLKDSVTYGATVYRALIGQEDVAGRIFSTQIQMLPDAQEIAAFEAILLNSIEHNPDIILFVDPFQLKRIAREDVKLAEVLFRRGQKKMLLDRRQQAQQQSDMNAEAQMRSAQVAEQEKRQTIAEESAVKVQVETAISKERQKEIVLTGLFNIYSKGVPMPTNLKSLESEMLENVALPLFAENMATAEQMMSNQEQQQEQPQQEQPQMEVPMQ